jgi:hypothetical protein
LRIHQEKFLRGILRILSEACNPRAKNMQGEDAKYLTIISVSDCSIDIFSFDPLHYIFYIEEDALEVELLHRSFILYGAAQCRALQYIS